ACINYTGYISPGQRAVERVLRRRHLHRSPRPGHCRTGALRWLLQDAVLVGFMSDYSTSHQCAPGVGRVALPSVSPKQYQDVLRRCLAVPELDGGDVARVDVLDARRCHSSSASSTSSSASSSRRTSTRRRSRGERQSALLTARLAE